MTIHSIYNQDGEFVSWVDDANLDGVDPPKNSCAGTFGMNWYYDFQAQVPVKKPPRPDGFCVFNVATKQWVIDSATAWEDVRNRRNALLSACDWTQLPDVPQATREAWAGYRQALRDVTQQADPMAIVWPVVPA